MSWTSWIFPAARPRKWDYSGHACFHRHRPQSGGGGGSAIELGADHSRRIRDNRHVDWVAILGLARIQRTSGRPPVVVGNILVSNSVQGVGINTTTHQAIFTDPIGPNSNFTAPSLFTFSMLNQAIS